MRILLFEPNWRSPISVLISIITRTPFTHAMIEIDGKYYDSSESRGDFNITSKHLMKGRLVYEWKFKSESKIEEFISQNLGRKYDYKGVFFYTFGKQDNKKFYCFEAALTIAKLIKGDLNKLPKQCNGGHILEYLGHPHKIYKF